MSELLKNIIRFFVFIGVQVYVLNQVPPLHKLVTPYIYFLYILWLPFSIKRWQLLAVGLLLGYTLDMFMKTPGIHAAPCVLIAYLRPFLINLLIQKESSEFNYIAPSPRSMNWTPYIVYVLVLTVVHHGYLVFLEWLQFGSFLYFVGKVLATTGISFALILLAELTFPRRLKYRTNTA